MSTRTLVSDDGITRVYSVSDGSKVIGSDRERILTTKEINAADLSVKGGAYLALPAPTQAQTTKAVRALVILQLQALDDVNGT